MMKYATSAVRLRWSPGIRTRIVGIVSIAAAGMIAAGVVAHRANERQSALAQDIDAQHAFLAKVNVFSSAVDGAQIAFSEFQRTSEPNRFAETEARLAEAGLQVRGLDAAARDESQRQAAAKLADTLRRIEAAVADVVPRQARSGRESLPELSAALEAESKKIAAAIDQLTQTPKAEALSAIGALHQALRIESRARLSPERMLAIEMDYALQDGKAGARDAGPAGANGIAAIDAYEKAFGDWLTAASASASSAAVARDVLRILAPIVHEIESAGLAEAETLSNHRHAESAKLALQLWLAFGGVTMLSLAAAVLVGRGITRSIGDIHIAMERVSRGEVELAIPHQDKAHEIGSMARSVSVFRDAMRERERLAREQLSDAERRGVRSERLTAFAAAFDRSIAASQAQLEAVSSELSAFARRLNDVSTHLERQMRLALEASDGTASQTEAVAAAAQELSVSIAEITQQMNAASASVREAADAGVMAESRMAALQSSAGEIGAVVSLINDIAGRTNLLALNATIEAARAGAAGRGFAVVAEEIKSLAAQTSRATDDIGARIASIQKSAGDGAAGVRALADRMQSVLSSATTVATAANQQDASVAEIARVSTELSGNARQASTASSEAFTVSADAVRMAHEIESLAGALASARAHFADETERFIAEVKAA